MEIKFKSKVRKPDDDSLGFEPCYLISLDVDGVERKWEMWSEGDGYTDNDTADVPTAEWYEALNEDDAQDVQDALDIAFERKEFFAVSEVSRADLIEQGYDANDLTNEQMQKIADAMGEGFTASGAYWDALEAIADELKITRLLLTN